MDDAICDWWETVDQIANTPARSPLSLRAKALAMKRLLECMTLTDLGRPKVEQLADANENDKLAWSLAADILALGGVA